MVTHPSAGSRRADPDPSWAALLERFYQRTGLSGPVLKELKGADATAGIPVVALTASAMAGDREKFLQAGCAGYLSKPFAVEDLLAAVQRFI